MILAIMSCLDSEEAGHKLLRIIHLEQGQDNRLDFERLFEMWSIYHKKKIILCCMKPFLE
jgi:hypothetical protein